MCLSDVYKGERKKKALRNLPDMITCWKVVRKYGNRYGTHYYPEYNYQNKCFSIGWNVTVPKRRRWPDYLRGFHAFRTQKTAEDWKGYDTNLHVIKCRIKKKDIVALGLQRDGLCLVTKRIWIPKPRRKNG